MVRGNLADTLRSLQHGDNAMALAEDRVIVTEEDSRRICRKTDYNVLTLLCWGAPSSLPTL